MPWQAQLARAKALFLFVFCFSLFLIAFNRFVFFGDFFATWQKNYGTIYAVALTSGVFSFNAGC